jgi:ADP-heptose:LPS heptosyltransferase
VFRALQLGDMLCAVPALRSLRAACPAARITLIGLPWARQLADRFTHYIDDFVPFPGLPGLPEQPFDRRQLHDFLQRSRAAKFDLAIQMHGDGTLTNDVVRALAARHTAGCYPPSGVTLSAQTYLPYREGQPEPLRNLAVVEHLGAPPAGHWLEFPLNEGDFQELDRALAGANLGEFVVIHPGGRSPNRRWDAASFARVATALGQAGYPIVLTGTELDRDATRVVRAGARADVLDLTGKTSLGATAALLSAASLVVCNDTGISHLAAALETPSVVIGRNSDPARWAPLDTERHIYLEHRANIPVDPGMVISRATDLLSLRRPVEKAVA